MTPKKRTSNAPLPAGDSDINAYHQRLRDFLHTQSRLLVLWGHKIHLRPAAIQLNSEETFYNEGKSRSSLAKRKKIRMYHWKLKHRLLRLRQWEKAVDVVYCVESFLSSSNNLMLCLSNSLNHYLKRNEFIIHVSRILNF